MCECRTTARRAGSGTAHGDEVQRPVEVPLTQREIARGDRRDEAIVEALRDSELRVDVIPAGMADCELVQAQHPRVEQAEDLDVCEVPAEQLAELLGAVLVDVPWIAR